MAGWKVMGAGPSEKMLIMLNFEGHDVPLEVNFDPGQWVKLGDLEYINDLPPYGNKSLRDQDSIFAGSGAAQNFVMPPYSGFIYKHLPA